MAGNSRPPSPSLRRLQSSLSNQTGHAPRDRRASSASSAAAVSFAVCGLTKQARASNDFPLMVVQAPFHRQNGT